MLKNIHSHLIDTHDGRIDYIRKLEVLYNSKEHDYLRTFLYDSLAYLDGKSSSLLQYNGIITASISIFPKLSDNQTQQAK